MMSRPQIEMELTQDVDPTMLITFFELQESVQIKKSFHAIRGDTSLVQIIFVMVGTWAAERYILDPFADRLEHWKKTATSLDGKQFKISITFKQGSLTSIETFRISNPLIIGRVWQIIRDASDLLAKKLDEISFDRILIVPDKQDQALIIGYQENRPTHVLDLESNRIVPIELQNEIRQFVITIGLM